MKKENDVHINVVRGDEREKIPSEQQKQQQRDDDKKINPQRKRIQAEYDLVSNFLAIFGRHHKRIVQQRRQTEDILKAQKQEGRFSSQQSLVLLENTPQLTETEQRVLSRTYYQNWTAGFMAGATTFGLLMGFSHWSARRMAARQGVLPPKPKQSYTNIDNPGGRVIVKGNNKSRHRLDHLSPSKSAATKPASTATTRQSYKHMDRKAFLSRREQKRAEQQAKQFWAMDPSSVLPSSLSAASTRSKPPSSAGASSSASTENDIMPQVQMMVYGGMAIVVTILTSWATIDKKQYHIELAKMPLAPGKSHLCHAACPEVVDKYQKIMTASSSSSLSSTTREKEEDDPAALSTDPATILQHPVTEEAEALSRLVINCQQRMQYEKDHHADATTNANGVHADDGNNESIVDVVVDVPEPGVPSNYSGITVEGSELWKASER